MEATKQTTEDQIQADIFQYAWNHLPQTRRLLFAVPNGGNRDIREAKKLQATGVVPGIPDLIFVWKGRAYGIEVKKISGHVSANQQKVHETWAEDGAPVYVVWSAIQGIKVIEDILQYGN